MAYPRFNQPLQTGSTGLRLPMPATTSPFYSSGWNPNQSQGIRIGEPLPSPGKIPSPSRQGPRPSGPQRVMPYDYTPDIATATPRKPKLEVSPYMETVYKSIQNIDPEQREEYLSTTAVSIKDRLDRYEFRIARGVPLTPEQQKQYDSIKNAYNDIQKYISNPSEYDAFFSGVYQQTNEQLAPALGLQNYGR